MSGRRGLPTLLGMLLLMSVAAACGDAVGELPGEIDSAEADEDGKFDVLRPTGEERMGHIRVIAPESELLVPEVLGHWDGRSLTSATTRVPTGTGCVEIIPSFQTAVGAYAPPSVRSRVCGVDVRASETTEVLLGGVSLVAMPEWTQGVFGSGGSRPQLARLTTRSDALSLAVQGNHLGRESSRAMLPVAPGDYHFSTLSLDRATIATFQALVEAGDVVEVPVPPLDLRARLRIVPPSRVFPAASSLSCAVFETALVRGPGALRPSDPLFRPGDFRRIDTSTAQSLSYLPVRDHANDAFALHVNNLIVPLELGFGDEREIRLARIDVDDVVIEREDGTAYSVAGSFEVFRQVDGRLEPVGRWRRDRRSGRCVSTDELVTRFPTRTGIDVLPGDYRVDVRYRTEIGQELDRYEMTLE